MQQDDGLLNRLRSRGQEVLTQVSAELSQNKHFMQAMAGALRGKEKLEEAVERVLRQMSVPTRGELRRAVARIDALERELASLKLRGARARPVKARKPPRKAR